MTRISLTIITPVLNGANTIEACLNSVASQRTDIAHIEHIVIDGGSVDRTLEVVSRFPGVRVISEPDEGIFDAMNKGIRLARGEVVGILNADDWYEPGALRGVLARFEWGGSDLGVVYGDQRRWTVEGTPYLVTPHHKRLKGWQRYLGMPLRHGSMFVRKQVYERLGTYNIRYTLTADYELTLRLLASDVPMAYLPTVLVNMREGGAGNVGTVIWERIELRHEAGMSFIPAFLLSVLISVKTKGFWKTICSVFGKE